jgi:hypothetical protein
MNMPSFADLAGKLAAVEAAPVAAVERRWSRRPTLTVR